MMDTTNARLSLHGRGFRQEQRHPLARLLRPGSLAVDPIDRQVPHDAVGHVMHRVLLSRTDVVLGQPVHYLQRAALGNPVDPALYRRIRPQPLTRVLLGLEDQRRQPP